MGTDFSVFYDDNGDLIEPCLLKKALAVALLQLASGQSAIKVTFRDRDAWFAKGEYSALLALKAQADADCDLKNGVTIRRRMAITGGFRRA